MSFCGLLCGRRASASTLRPCDGSHSSAEAHARLRHIRRWRRAASRQELMALVSKARVDDDDGRARAARTSCETPLITGYGKYAIIVRITRVPIIDVLYPR